MRFAILRKADPDTEAGARAGPALIHAMADYVQEMVDAGVMRSGEGLRPSAQGARVSFAGGVPSVIDGPFAEAKELVAGISIIETATLEEAVAWVKRWPPLDGGGNVQIEIRPLYELDDLGEGEGIERHARLQQEMHGG